MQQKLVSIVNDGRTLVLVDRPGFYVIETVLRLGSPVSCRLFVLN